MWKSVEYVRDYLIRRLLGMKDKKIEIGLYDNIEDVNRWINIYEGNPPWLDEETTTRNLADSIVAFISRKATIEMVSNVVSKIEHKEGKEVAHTKGPRAKYLDTQYQRLVSRTRTVIEQTLVQGGAILKPYIDNGQINVELVLPDRFVPIKFNNNGELVDVIFIDKIVKKGKTYTKLERHFIDGSNYTITNSVHLGDGINSNGEITNEVSVDLVPEWAALDLKRELTIANLSVPLFTYIKNPTANNKDVRSPLGVSVISRIENLLRDYDVIYSIYLWELEGSALQIAVPDGYVKEQNLKGQNAISGTFDNFHGRRKEVLKRLYVKLDMDSLSSNETGLTIFSPKLREADYNAGMEKILRMIEFNVGLGYGDLSKVADVEKTAEEIRAGKQTTYNTLVNIQDEITKAYTKIVEIMNIYLDLTDENGEPVLWLEDPTIKADQDEVEVTFYYDDSILNDKKNESQQLLDDVEAGRISTEFYLSKVYGVTFEQAQAMMPQKPPTVEKEV